jgi:hypothetical protein
MVLGLAVLAVALAIVIWTPGSAPDTDAGEPDRNARQPRTGAIEESVSPRTSTGPRAGGSQPLSPAEQAALEQQQTLAISTVLSSEQQVGEKADEIIRMLPDLRGDVQTLAAAHVADLAESAQLHEAAKLINDPRINPEAREKLFNSFFDAEPLDAAALLVEVLQSGSVAFSDEAQTTLAILLKVDYGSDIAAWKREIAAQRAAAGSAEP